MKKKLPNTSNSNDLDGLSAIVTGAGSGLGKSIAIGIAEAGANVAIMDIDEKEAAKTSCLIEKEFPNISVVAISCDVTAEDDVERAIAQISQNWKVIDILVNAAGIAPAYPLVDFPVDKWRLALEVNMTGYFLMAKHIAKIMIAQGMGGSIINISSKSGLDAS